VDHIKCAAFELPFSAAEAFGKHDVQEILGLLAEQGLVHLSGDAGDHNSRWTWTNESYPADAVSLRSVSSDNFVIVDITDESHVIGETDFTSGPATLHPKAIYIVEGRLFQVERFDFEGRKAYVRHVDCDYYTDAITYTRVTSLDTFETDREHERAAPHVHSHGEVHVVSRVVGFKKIKFYTNENVGSGELDLPEQQMHTTAYCLTIPETVMALLPYAADDRRDGVVGLSFAMRQIAQLLLMCDRHDVGISIDSDDASENPAPAITKARIFVYDNYPGGIGFSAPLFRMHHELLEATRKLISDCECESGCPGCVGPAGNTGPLAKTAALRILDLLLTPALDSAPANALEATA
jgi:DEAD/DEAH box helicase domain-containing protein